MEFLGELKNGEKVYKYTLDNKIIKVSVINLGGTLTNFFYKGRDIVCGFDTLDQILKDDSYQGALIGRYGNRIGGAKFTLDAKEYKLYKNDNNNHLHGGKVGFNRKIWNVTEVDDNKITLTTFSCDGEEGYPGNLKVSVTYSIDGTALRIDYKAISDKKTVINLTNHAYFNIEGYNAGSILDQKIMICANKYTEVDSELIPTGKEPYVEGTIFDLRKPIEMGKYIGKDFGGYDHNFIFDEKLTSKDNKHSLPHVATVFAKEDTMKVYTNQPCVQLYIGNALTGTPNFKGGYKKAPHTTYCLETQIAPDSPNHGKGILPAYTFYNTSTVYELGEK